MYRTKLTVRKETWTSDWVGVRMSLLFSASVCPHDKTETAETKIAKLGSGIIIMITRPPMNIRPKGHRVTKCITSRWDSHAAPSRRTTRRSRMAATTQPCRTVIQKAIKWSASVRQFIKCPVAASNNYEFIIYLTHDKHNQHTAVVWEAEWLSWRVIALVHRSLVSHISQTYSVTDSSGVTKSVAPEARNWMPPHLFLSPFFLSLPSPPLPSLRSRSP